MYVDASVVVEGAVEEDATFHDYLLFEEWLRGVEEDAAGHGYLTEVYVIEHEHDDLKEDEECACVQYLTDHHPAYVYNGPES